nr:ferredoxin [Selenomonas noxia]
MVTFMNLSIDSTACISCGMCEERLPAVFHIDRTQRSAIILRQPTCLEQDDALEAAEDCPVGAISSAVPAKT